MKKDKLQGNVLEIIKDELSILAMLDHVNIINHLESYEDERYFYIVMECMKNGSELLDLIANKVESRSDKPEKNSKPLFSEKRVAHIMHMLLSATNHIHKNGIVHRDLKPENILIDSKTN
jgi:serine/threonine protein kinase